MGWEKQQSFSSKQIVFSCAFSVRSSTFSVGQSGWRRGQARPRQSGKRRQGSRLWSQRFASQILPLPSGFGRRRSALLCSKRRWTECERLVRRRVEEEERQELRRRRVLPDRV